MVIISIFKLFHILWEFTKDNGFHYKIDLSTFHSHYKLMLSFFYFAIKIYLMVEGHLTCLKFYYLTTTQSFKFCWIWQFLFFIIFFLAFFKIIIFLPILPLMYGTPKGLKVYWPCFSRMEKNYHLKHYILSINVVEWAEILSTHFHSSLSHFCEVEAQKKSF